MAKVARILFIVVRLIITNLIKDYFYSTLKTMSSYKLTMIIIASVFSSKLNI